MACRKDSRLETNVYRIRSRSGASRAPIRIALATDLHDRDPEAVLAAIRRSEPDLIALAGDILECRGSGADMAFDEPDRRSSAPERFLLSAFYRADAWLSRILGRREQANDNRNALYFIGEAARIAPTFFSLGNHERGITPRELERIRRAGATISNASEARIRVKGAEIRVGGLASLRDAAWLSRFERDDGATTVLLCHRPEYYDAILRDTRVDLILSGHAHGGQWRVFGYPLFAPGQGLFPKYSSGVYDNRLIVSRGLANTAHVPRFGNPTELVIVELYAAADENAPDT